MSIQDPIKTLCSSVDFEAYVVCPVANLYLSVSWVSVTLNMTGELFASEATSKNMK
jgi:hypothetical protein